ncbi:MAG: hypothetical protein ACYS7Y_35840, partial [Planctomycetota bacterium]
IEKSQELSVPDFDADLTWTDFCKRYEDEALGDAPVKTRRHWATARDWYRNLMEPKFLDEVTSSSLSRFQPKLRAALEAKNGQAPASTVGSYLKQLRAAFNWAYRIRLLLEPVEIIMPRRARKGGKFAKSRPVTLEEFERIVAKAETVRPNDYAQWQRLLWGYWHSGFRLRELLALSWDSSADVAIVTQYTYPLVRFTAAGHKRGEDQYQVITPEFWNLIKDQPQEGPVFPVVDRDGCQYDSDWIGTVIRKCGVGVKTGLLTDKTASCHDLGKRSWTTRWSGELSEADLANLARHKSSQTTQDYYVLPALEELALKVGWGGEE